MKCAACQADPEHSAASDCGFERSLLQNYNCGTLRNLRAALRMYARIKDPGSDSLVTFHNQDDHTIALIRVPTDPRVPDSLLDQLAGAPIWVALFYKSRVRVQCVTVQDYEGLTRFPTESECVAVTALVTSLTTGKELAEWPVYYF